MAGQTVKDFSKILKYVKPYKKSIVIAFLCLTLSSVINLILPLIVKNMINAAVVEKNSVILNCIQRVYKNWFLSINNKPDKLMAYFGQLFPQSSPSTLL